jgi:hypothetical protein
MRKRIFVGAGAAIAMAFSWTTAQAQEGFYFGPEGGWTGLQGTKSSITGTNPVTGQIGHFSNKSIVRFRLERWRPSGLPMGPVAV